jgi:hypothetical protein
LTESQQTSDVKLNALTTDEIVAEVTSLYIRTNPKILKNIGKDHKANQRLTPKLRCTPRPAKKEVLKADSLPVSTAITCRHIPIFVQI